MSLFWKVIASKRVPREFYTRKILIVGKDLLGKYLVKKIGKKKLVGKIVGTEALAAIVKALAEAMK